MYLWIVITGGVFSFFAAMGIGANDVANAFATSVGSKALTIKKAVVLAAIFETSGAILMGSHVSETIRKDIADYKCFEEQPDVLMYGCMWVVLSVGLWLFIASYFEMPVSTTHSCVGGMIGMAWALGGINCINWYELKPTFPYIGGVAAIVVSWFLAPVLSGLIATFIFFLIRKCVLRYNYQSYRINFIYPILIGFTITLNTFFIIYKGAKGIGLDKIDPILSVIISCGLGLLSSILTIIFISKLKILIKRKFAYLETPISIEMTEISKWNIVNKKEEERVKKLHNDAEKFDPKVEEMFKYLQIFTAICGAFSHGANDVANAIGPFAAIYTIYQVNNVEENSVMDSNSYWILALGGLGISIGFLVYGYKITYAIGSKLCKISPSRGVAIELSSAMVIIAGSRLKIPLSTTHCQIGSTIGVGLLENIKKCSGINCKILMKTIFGWIITCIIVGLSAALLSLQGVHSPCINNSFNITV